MEYDERGIEPILGKSQRVESHLSTALRMQAHSDILQDCNGQESNQGLACGAHGRGEVDMSGTRIRHGATRETRVGFPDDCLQAPTRCRDELLTRRHALDPVLPVM